VPFLTLFLSGFEVRRGGNCLAIEKIEPKQGPEEELLLSCCALFGQYHLEKVASSTRTANDLESLNDI
jgi:hypothetical protein